MKFEISSAFIYSWLKNSEFKNCSFRTRIDFNCEVNAKRICFDLIKFFVSNSIKTKHSCPKMHIPYDTMWRLGIYREISNVEQTFIYRARINWTMVTVCNCVHSMIFSIAAYSRKCNRLFSISNGFHAAKILKTNQTDGKNLMENQFSLGLKVTV